ncbi:MAG TPA: Asp-tRNA(Asn)/Glu-tRNA(Gln) amidotransferase subunit GatC [Thermomicrobiales bacterium]|nr:Asp-tRNA(Asn)/Glu-tRNA(Gln) amidotransferase subunit GatC [Thermomicrobiales bacterium]
MALTVEQVQHVAMLARLGLNDEERERFREQLSTILAHIDQLGELDLAAIPPTAQVIPLAPVLREDVVEPSLPVEQVLANAPRREDGFIKVRAVLQ